MNLSEMTEFERGELKGRNTERLALAKAIGEKSRVLSAAVESGSLDKEYGAGYLDALQWNLRLMLERSLNE